MIKFSETENELRHPAALTHQGRVIAFAVNQPSQIFYRVLDLDPTQNDDDEGWRDRKLLKFPREIRPAGMSVFTLEDRMFKGQSKDAPPFQGVLQPFQVLSTGQYVYLFRQSPHNTIYVNRYVFDPGTLELKLAWEPRFQRSRKHDLPASQKDTLGTRDMEDEPFEEPTLDLHFVRDVKEGRFVVLRLPTTTPDVFRWQIFTTTEDGSIHQYSIKQSSNGLFDRNPSNYLKSSFQVTITNNEALPDSEETTALIPQAGPGATLYALQEDSVDTYGRTQRLKREQRVLVAIPFEFPHNPNVTLICLLDSGLTSEGTLPEVADAGLLHMDLLGEVPSSSFALPVINSQPYNPTQPLVRGSLEIMPRAHSAPIFLDSADGLIHMYYSGSDKLKPNYYTLHYNTLASRAEFDLTTETELLSTPGLRFVPHRTGRYMNGLIIRFENGTTDDTCNLIISIEDVVETWRDLPRSIQELANILNGNAANNQADPGFVKGTIPFYDYENKLSRQGLPAGVNSSMLVAAQLINMPDDVSSVRFDFSNPVEPSRTTNGSDPLWLAEPENNAIQFRGNGGFQVEEGLDLDPGSITVEAWVKPEYRSEEKSRRLIHYHNLKSNISYELYVGLIESSTPEGYQIYAATRQVTGQRGKAVKTPNLDLNDRWNHIAAVYRSGSALNLDGYSYANCGNEASLRGLAKSMAVEAWVVPDEASLTGTQPIFSKWGPKIGDQSWMLYLENGVPTFKICWQHENEDATSAQIFEIRGNVQVPKENPTHLAAIFDFEPREQEALNFSGTNQARVNSSDSLWRYIRTDYTVEMWVQVKDTDAPVSAILANDAAQGPYFIYYHNPTSEAPGKIGFGRYKFPERDAAAGLSESSLIPNTWHHLALVKRDHKLTLFIDGKLEREIDDIPWERSFIRPKYEDLILWIGSDINGYKFKGLINDIRLWDHARTQEQILSNMDNRELSSEGGLLLYLPMEKGSALGDEVADRSGNNNNLKLLDGLTTTTIDKCTYQVHLQAGENRISRSVETDTEKRKEVILRESASEVLIGSAYGYSSYKGQIDEVRIWQVHRHKKQIDYYGDRSISQGAVGLVSEWRFEETPGARSTLDSKSDNHARLIHPDKEKIAQMLVPTELRAGWRIYVNGEEQILKDDNDFWQQDDQRNVGQPFTIGGVGRLRETHDGEFVFFSQGIYGVVDEIRIWRAQHTAEQVRDYMYRRLTGLEDDLWGYWTFDASKTMFADYSGNGRNGHSSIIVEIVPGSPIGNERPEVRYALSPADVDSSRWATITDRPAVAEYGDMQFDANGNMMGVMKRCYLYTQWRNFIHVVSPDETWESIAQLYGIGQQWLKDINPQISASSLAEGMTLYLPWRELDAIPSDQGELFMASGFAIGNLDLQFITQVQTAPTLIGYIEGAPPVPSENLTVNTIDQEIDTYAASSSVELVEARDRIQIFNATRDVSRLLSFDTQLGASIGEELQVGMAVQKKVADIQYKMGYHKVVDQSDGMLNEATLSSQASQTLRSKMSLSGTWEQPNEKGEYLNPVVKQRYIPNNVGYALVKSGTADLYGLRLRQTGSLVAYNLMPNPDIPVDWNIIMFPINPKYTKNGTLDGMVGTVEDLDYRGASRGKRGSYFKPIEAYALKAKIRRQEKQIASYSERFGDSIKNKEYLSHKNTNELFKNDLKETYNQLGYDWEQEIARRSLVNTYVWTASGGFYSEEEQFANIRQESLGGHFESSIKEGIALSYDLKVFGIGAYFQLDALVGTQLNVTNRKTEQRQAVFNLNVNVDGEGFLNHLDAKTNKYTSELSPGKVTGYRFMTFYLAPDNNNFDAFFAGRNPVVDPDWLANSQGKFDPDALALKAAMTRPNKVWRVMHRTTYVSRVPEEIGNPPEELKSPQDPIPENVDSNWDVIESIKVQAPSLTKSDGSLDLIALGQAVDAIVDSKLSELLPWWQAVAEEKNKHKIKRSFRDDLMTYAKNYFTVYPYESGKVTTSGISDIVRPSKRYVSLLGHPIQLSETEPDMPGSPNPTRYEWKQVAGPGIAEFSPNPRMLNPFVSISKSGNYRLEMTAVVDQYQTTRLVEIEVLDETPYTLVTTDRLKLRQGPGTDYAQITVLPAQEKIKLLARNADASWFYVRVGSMTGWVSAEWTSKPKNLQLAEVPVLEKIVTFG